MDQVLIRNVLWQLILSMLIHEYNGNDQLHSRSRTLCAQDITAITCPAGKLLMIEEAAYGRMDSYTCTEPGDEEPSRCGDEHQSALREVSSFCFYRTSCSLSTHHLRQLKTVCDSQMSYLHYSYTCLQSNRFQELHSDMAYIIDMDVVLFTPAYPHSRIHSSLQNVTLQTRDVNNYLEIIVYDMNLQKESRELCYFIVALGTSDVNKVEYAGCQNDNPINVLGEVGQNVTLSFSIAPSLFNEGNGILLRAIERAPSVEDQDSCTELNNGVFYQGNISGYYSALEPDSPLQLNMTSNALSTGYSDSDGTLQVQQAGRYYVSMRITEQSEDAVVTGYINNTPFIENHAPATNEMAVVSLQVDDVINFKLTRGILGSASTTMEAFSLLIRSL